MSIIHFLFFPVYVKYFFPEKVKRENNHAKRIHNAKSRKNRRMKELNGVAIPAAVLMNAAVVKGRLCDMTLRMAGTPASGNT